ncbi:MAG: hypothetical protein KC766_24435 [Myxococcales bacterium]|nr:hypothetical protein [Myxococcales bacterium]
MIQELGVSTLRGGASSGDQVESSDRGRPLSEPPLGPRREFGAAWHRRVAGLHVLKLKGSFYEMGLQHGTLLREHIPTGPVSYFSEYLEKLLRPLGGAAPIARRALQQTVGRSVERQLPAFAREALRGLADGAELDERHLLDGSTMPDAMLWVVTQLTRLGRPGPAVRHRLDLSLGCTSAVAWGEATQDGKLLHARNFDYHGVGTWPKHQAVVFHEPDEGMRYVSVAAAGILLGGVTAMNEAGLTLTMHQHMFTDQVRLGGTPVGTVGDIVMRHAENLEEAEAILRAHRPIGCWTYIITDGKRREVLCFEENPARQVAIRRAAPDTHFGYANVFLDPELGATEQNLYPSYWRANAGRHARVNQLLEQHAGRINQETMAEILADTGNNECRLRASISMLMTVASVVFKPEDGIVWVATGDAPTAANRFEAFSLKTEDHAPLIGAVPSTEGRAAPDRASGLVPSLGAARSARAGFAAYSEAFLAYTDAEDLSGARRRMAEACELQPDQPLFHNLRGLLELQAGNVASSEEAFERVLQLGHPDPERVAAAYVWRARCRDLSGRRSAAVKDYRAALAGTPDPVMRRAARRGLMQPYNARRARKLNIEFSYADVVAP